MGWGMYTSIRDLGIKPFITDRVYAEEAIHAYLKGNLDDHRERLH